MSEVIHSASDTKTVSTRLEISVRGQWVETPAIVINGQTIVVKGDRIRLASLHDEEWSEDELLDPEACMSKLKQASGIPRADILTFTQKVPNALPRYSYPMQLRSDAVADVSDFKAWWESLPQETRKNVRRSQKRGVTIQVRHFDADVIRGIADVQNESPVRQGRPYPHYGKSFEQVKRDHGAFVDRSDFICAYFGEEFIGCLKLVYRGNIASILQCNSKIAHYDKRPSNALIARAAELCAARGITHLTYGRFSYGNRGQAALRIFKERHGFAEMLVPSYYVPLTAWGAICVKTRLYRNPIDFIPQRWLRVALDLRTRWYNSKTTSRPV
ncbi:MAG: GNAT family N-acetyltransferase [Terracidiphilus sp.]